MLTTTNFKSDREKRDKLALQVLQDMGIQNLVNLETLQNLQDNLAAVTGIAMVTVDYRGNPITSETNFSSFCRACRKIEKCKANCFFSDAYGSLKAAMTNKPYLYHCPMGLVDCAVPIIVENHHIGGVLMGQVRCHDAETGNLEVVKNIVQNEIDLEEYPDLKKMFYDTEEISLSHLKKTAQLVQYLVSEMVEKELMLRVQDELRDETTRLSDKISLMESEHNRHIKRTQSMHESFISQYMLTTLNMLSTMAITEEAEYTLEGIDCYTKMLVKVHESNWDLIPLHTEISFIRKAVKVLKKFFKKDILLEIIVEDAVNECHIPPFIIYPFLENSILHGIVPQEGAGKITIDISCQNDNLQIKIKDNGLGFNTEYFKDDTFRYSKVHRLSSLDIETTKERLVLLYDEHSKIELTGTRGNAEVIITVPANY